MKLLDIICGCISSSSVFLSGFLYLIFYIQKKNRNFDYQAAIKYFVTFLIIGTVFEFWTNSVFFQFFEWTNSFVPERTFLPLHIFTLVENALVQLYCSRYQYKDYRKWTYSGIGGFAVLWVILKVNGLEPFDTFDSVSAGLSSLILFMASRRAMIICDEESELFPRKDGHFYILKGLRIYYLGCIIIFLVFPYFPLVKYGYYVMSTYKNGAFIIGLYRFYKMKGEETYPWLRTL